MACDIRAGDGDVDTALETLGLVVLRQTSPMPTLRRIWIKRARRRARRGPMDPKESATLVEGRGLLDNTDWK